MKKITYLLGAGASYNSIPIYKEFSERFKLFVDQLSTYLDTDISNRQPYYGDLISLFKVILNELGPNKTPDLLANKLNARGDRESRILLAQLKMIISLYLIFEQCSKRDGYFQTDKFKKTDASNLDTRYEYFLASIIDPNSKTLRRDINILSWNYDLQLELAYCSRFNVGIYEAMNNLEIFNPTFSYFPSDNPSIVKLNGTAGLFLLQEKVDYNCLIDPYTDVFNHSVVNDFYESLSNTFESQKVSSSIRHNSSKIQPHLYFAWEGYPNAVKSREMAKNLLAETNELIILGYSFHNFNREIDTSLFSAAKNLKKVVLQVYKDDMSRIKGTVNSILREALPNNTIQIVEHGEVSEFYLPVK